MSPLLIFALLVFTGWVDAFCLPPLQKFLGSTTICKTNNDVALVGSCHGSKDSNNVEIVINPQLDDEKIKSLFAWVSLALRGDPEYNNLMLAIAAVFGDLPPDSLPVQMAKKSLELLPAEEELVGDKFSIEEREYNSLG